MTPGPGGLLQPVTSTVKFTDINGLERVWLAYVDIFLKHTIVEPIPDAKLFEGPISKDINGKNQMDCGRFNN